MTDTDAARPASRPRLPLLLAALAATVAAAVWPEPDIDADADRVQDLVAPRPAGRSTAASSTPPVQVAPSDRARDTAAGVAAPHAPGSTRVPIDEDAGTTLFGAEPPPPPPPPPPPVRTAAVAPVAPPPAPAATPRGLLLDGDHARALLETADGRLLALRTGEAFDGEWRLDAVDARSVVVVHLPTGRRQSLPQPAPLDPHAAPAAPASHQPPP